MAPQHGRKISTQLCQPLLCTLFILDNNIVAVLLESSLSVPRVLDGPKLRVFDGGSNSLFPRPVGLDGAAAEKLDEGRLSFLGSGILGIVGGGDEGLGLDVVAEGQLARFTKRFTMIAVVVATSKPPMRATALSGERSGRSPEQLARNSGTGCWGLRDTHAGVVGVASPPAKARLYASGISHELCFDSVLYQYLRPPSAVYSFHGWFASARWFTKV